MVTTSAQIFNSTLASYAISGTFEIGLLGEIEKLSEVNISQFCSERKLHLPSVEALIRCLVAHRILKYEAGVVSQGIEFQDVFANKGYFLWLIRGYGDCLRRAAEVCKLAKRDKEFVKRVIKRDGEFIALAGKDYGHFFVDATVENVLSNLSFKCIADLGCGSGERLAMIVEKRSHCRGLGFDSDGGAVAVAKEIMTKRGLQERVRIMQADVTTLSFQPEFSEVDILMCFFLGHEMWPRSRCIDVLSRLRESFPSCSSLLLCDTYRFESTSTSDIPIFTLGFETTHSMMGQYIPQRREWLDLFPESGWRCSMCIDIGIPSSTIFVLEQA